VRIIWCDMIPSVVLEYIVIRFKISLAELEWVCSLGIRGWVMRAMWWSFIHHRRVWNAIVQASHNRSTKLPRQTRVVVVCMFPLPILFWLFAKGRIARWRGK
jgi:hypothetical protein